MEDSKGYLGPRKSAVIFTGLQAAGKTAFYNGNFADTHVHISLDELHTRSREKLLLGECIGKGASFAVDNTNITADGRARYIKPAKEAGYIVTGFFFRSPARECAARNERREEKAKVPAEAIWACAERLEEPKFCEGYDEIYDVWTERGEFRAEKRED